MATNRRRRAVLWIVALIGVLYVGHVLGITRPLEAGIRFLASPVTGALHRFAQGTSHIGERFRTASRLQRENIELREQLGDALAKNAELQAAQRDLQAAEPLLEFLKPIERKVVLGRVVAQGADPATRTITVNRGQADGLALGTPALVNRGFFIGKVIELDAHTARIRLVSDSQTAVAALVEQGDGVPGLLIGEHGLSLRLTLIPKNQTINAGDRVITSGLEPNIPRGLIIGTVQDVTQDSGDLFQQARIVPSANLDALSVIAFLPA
jgi:rod shape-determining protein MreC